MKEIECNGAEVFNELDSRYLESDRNRRDLKDIVDEVNKNVLINYNPMLILHMHLYIYMFLCSVTV